MSVQSTPHVVPAQINSEDFRILPGRSVDLAGWPTIVKPFFQSQDQYLQILGTHVQGLSARQDVHRASGRYAVLIIFQGMDCAGKDGSIQHVMSGVNPEACEVFSFKSPSAEELRHDFLWRTTCRLPERGRIGIFNRSYYEEVLIVRVHPAILKAQNLPTRDRLTMQFWQDRFRSILEFEEHLQRNGTQIVKIFLHVSKEEQKKRLLQRLYTPDSNWKFSESDVRERKYWRQYLRAHSDCLAATSTHDSPWYAVPADDKENARLIVSQILMDAFDALKMAIPRSTPKRLRELHAIGSLLEKSRPPVSTANRILRRKRVRAARP